VWRSFLLLFKFLLIELELFSLQDVSVDSSGLTWSRTNASEQSSRVELVSDSLFNGSAFLSALELSLKVLGSLHILSGFFGLSNLLFVKFDIIVLEIPSSEWICVDLHNTVLDKSLGSDQFVVGGIIDDI